MIPYSIHVAILLAICLLFYRLFLQKETYYGLNRIILLTCLALAFILPFVPVPEQFSIRTAKHETDLSSYVVPDIKESAVNPGNSIKLPDSKPALTVKKSSGTAGSGVSHFLDEFTMERAVQWALWLYWSGVIIFAINLLIQILVLMSQSYKKPAIQDGIYRIVELDTDKAPCSFGNIIFINPSKYDWETYNQILLHEKVHIQQRHSIDLIVAELMLVVQWFNPFAWVYRKELESNLEFLTDQSVLRGNQIAPEEYQMSLLKVSVPNFSMRITTNYNQSLLKKRLLMMNSRQSNIHILWKYLMLVPLAVIMVCCLNEPVANSAEEVRSANGELHARALVEAMDRTNITESEELNKKNTAAREALLRKNTKAMEVIDEKDTTAREILARKNAMEMRDLERKYTAAMQELERKYASARAALIKKNTEPMQAEAKQNTAAIQADAKKNTAALQAEARRNTAAMQEKARENTAAMQAEARKNTTAMRTELGKGIYDFNSARFKNSSFPSNNAWSLGSHSLTSGSVKESLAIDKTMDFNTFLYLKDKGIDAAYIKGMREAGITDGNTIVYFNGKHIDPSYLQGLRDAGLKDLSTNTVTYLQSKGVTPEDVKSIIDAGYENPDANEIAFYHSRQKTKASGIDAAITAAYINDFQRINYKDTSPNTLREFKAAGITASFVNDFQRINYKDLSANTLIEFKKAGITASYINGFQRINYQDLTVQTLIAFKKADITASYINGFQRINYKDMSAATMLLLKSKTSSPQTRKDTGKTR